LERLLTSRFFISSKRCPAMLRYIVLHTLEGKGGSLKERRLGIEVFRRAADYDNNNDPIVRLAAVEIRKRLAQYYCEPEHAGELRFSLPTGSYLPEFHWPEAQSAPANVPILVAPVEMSAPAQAVPPVSGRIWRAAVVAGVLLLIAAAGFAALKLTLLRPASDRFWGDVLNSKIPALICVGQPDRWGGEANYKKLQEQANLGVRVAYLDQISIYDAIAVARIAGFLAKANVPESVEGEESATLDDMRRGPVVLVSGADNPWTLRATSNLRFHFDGAPSGDNSARVWIADRSNPSSRLWQVDFSIPYNAFTQDYALVGRFNNPATGETNVIAAGIGANGTLVASECLTDSNCLKTIIERDPARGRKNIEAVLGTQVIDGKSGPPTVLAVHSW
jgi:hypothetical protein